MRWHIILRKHKSLRALRVYVAYHDTQAIHKRVGVALLAPACIAFFLLKIICNARFLRSDGNRTKVGYRETILFKAPMTYGQRFGRYGWFSLSWPWNYPSKVIRGQDHSKFWILLSSALVPQSKLWAYLSPFRHYRRFSCFVTSSRSLR